MTTRKVIIDCDTGVDDALALLLALRWPGYEVIGITNVAGNVGLQKVVPNTLKVVEHAGRTTPVYSGAPRPMLGKWEPAEYVHGTDGLGDIGFPASSQKAQAEHAVDYLIRTYRQATEPIELITLGPLTNLALALTMAPDIEDRIPSLVMMAGGITGGNTTAAAEFNIIVDPEAADLVFRSRIPKTMVPLEPIWEDGKLDRKDMEEIASVDAPWCKLASALLKYQLNRWEQLSGKPRPASPPDLMAVAVAIDPTLADSQDCAVSVELNGTHTRGMTVVDRRWFRRMLQPDNPNCTVVFRADGERYRRLVLDTYKAL